MTTPWNTNKVNGHANAGEFLGRQLDYYLITSPVNIVPNGSTSLGNSTLIGNTVTQLNLDKLIEVISINGQPVILGNTFSVDGINCSLAFAIEHTGAWGNTTATAIANLQNSIVANAPQQVTNGVTWTVGDVDVPGATVNNGWFGITAANVTVSITSTPTFTGQAGQF